MQGVSGETEEAMRSDAEAAASEEQASDVKAPTPSETTKNSQEDGAKESDKYGKGVIFYLNSESRVVGLLMWNVFGRMGLARKVLRDNKKYEDLSELAKLFNIHGEESQ